MTQTSRFWDGTTLGDATAAPYDAATEFSKVLMSISGAAGVATNLSGVFRAELNELAVTGVATPVSINTGRAITWGTWFENDAATTVAIPTPSVSTRIDRIVLRKDWVAQTVRVTRIAGSEGAGAPAMTQSQGVTWDEPLALVTITTGGVITVTDQRAFLGGGGLPTPTGTNSILTSNAGVAAWASAPTINGPVTISGALGAVYPFIIQNTSTTGFSGVALRDNAGVNRLGLVVYNGSYVGNNSFGVAGASTVEIVAPGYPFYIGTSGSFALNLATNSVVRVTIPAAGGLTVTGTLGATSVDSTGIQILMNRVNNNYLTASDAAGILDLGVVGTTNAIEVSALGHVTLAKNLNLTTGNITLSVGNIVMAANSQIGFGVGGAGYGLITAGTGGLFFVNNAGNANNLIITDAGVMTVRAGETITAGGLRVTAGNVGIGVAPAVNTGLYISGAILSGSGNQYGIIISPTASNAAVTSINGVYISLITAALSFVVPSGYGVLVDSPTLGAGSSVTAIYGISINNQGVSGKTTSAFGLNVSSQTGGGVNNYGIVVGAPSTGSGQNIGIVNAGTTHLGSTVGIGIAPVSYVGIYLQNSILLNAGGSTSHYGIFADATIGQDASNLGIAIYTHARTTAAAICNVGSLSGLYVDVATKGHASSTHTFVYGIYVVAQATGSSGNYGVYINAPAAAAAGNFSLFVYGGDSMFGGAGALATSNQVGFVWLPSCAGTPTGVPLNTGTGAVPVLFDTTNSRFYARIGGTWKSVVLA